MTGAQNKPSSGKTRVIMRHDPVIGTRYIPGLKARVSGERGGYLVRTNSSGFRSERDFAPERTPGKSRAIIFGDSQTAGDGVPNKLRFSDRLEAKIPQLEVYNFGIGGTGPDQHFLAYKQNDNIEHDLLIIVVYVENIRRISRRAIRSKDHNGLPVVYPKPYFEMSDGILALRNVPVPKETWREGEVPKQYEPYIYSFDETNVTRQLTGKDVIAPWLPAAFTPLRKIAKDLLLQMPGVGLLPEYDTPASAGWLLLQTIMSEWIKTSTAPTLIVTIPHAVSFTTSRNPTRYQARFHELAQSSGCFYYDFLPDLLRVSRVERPQLWSEWSSHLTASGHELLAESIAPIVKNLLHIP